MRKYVTEFIGTFFLVLVIGLTVSLKQPMAPLAIGAILMTMVYMGGHVSGAHYNPAVSLAALVRGRLSPLDFVIYVVVQVIGGLAAAEVVLVVLDKTFPPPMVQPGPGHIGLVEVLALEAIFTFALALVVLNAATAKGTAGNSFYGLAIGFTVLAGAIAAGPLTGGVFNPAVGTGAIVMDLLVDPGNGSINSLWIYWAAPLVGGLAAGIVFKVQNPDDA